MDKLLKLIETLNDAVNGFVWGIPMLILLVGTGIIMTFVAKWFQVFHIRHWLKNTLGAIFKKDSNVKDKSDKHAISQFQSLCTALAATVGTGNIAGVATAIAAGGPGAVFWMWIAAFFGMMTKYSESVLGIYYRRKNQNGEWSGGAMYYLRDGLGSKKYCKHLGKILAILFSFFAILASFGIGNLAQINTISSNVNSVFGLNVYIIGAVLFVVGALIIIGGIKRIASVTDKIVPFMVIFYIIGTLTIFIMNISKAGEIFSSIFRFAFGFDALKGATIGLTIKSAITLGFKRGVFSNEAGLGSSVMAHSASNVKEPVRQGFWGIFEVFADTIIICTLTAFTILASDAIDLNEGVKIIADKDNVLVTYAFTKAFGSFGGYFIAVAILLFAFSTTLGWSYYGTKSWEFLFGTKSTAGYKIIFVAMIFISAIIPTAYAELPWEISDTFNGLMAIPNLIGILSLSGTVYAITKNYVNRHFKHKDIAPMLSAFPDIQKEQEKKIKQEA